ncbi:MAG: sigma-54-dependent Fis family transcriptional regulator, partial [bacterium]|nr:sigma-54-dependent Fis family transcriptional regulator [bacterium]
AYDYLVKPISREELVTTINRALERKRLYDIIDLGKKLTLPQLKNKKAFKPIVTRNKNVLRSLKEAELHARSDVPILITGASGTGKELLARAIHAASQRADFPLTSVNMASLTPSLFDAEFFGHTKGAFTGAEVNRDGHLERTNKGTLFLDEFGTLAPELQGKLLRVLQEGEFFKLGTSAVKKVDVRFIAATNVDLEKLMAAGAFRKDLYYRLRGGWLHLPPLNERKDDIPLLVRHFLNEFGQKAENEINAEALELLTDYNYPGNIRELKSIIQSAVNMAQGNPIKASHLPHYFDKKKKSARQTPKPVTQKFVPLATMEKDYIRQVYRHLEKNKTRSAELLGISINTLRRKLKTHQIK